MNKSQKAKIRRGMARHMRCQAPVRVGTNPTGGPPIAVAELPNIMPKAATGLDSAFGPSRISDWLPARKDIPESFTRSREYHTWESFVSGWFFSGANAQSLVAKPGIDKRAALRHVGVCLGSLEPKHEHKIDGCAYLMSLWFEVPRV